MTAAPSLFTMGYHKPLYFKMPGQDFLRVLAIHRISHGVLFPDHLICFLHNPFHCIEDVLISGAPAQMAGNQFAQFLPVVPLSCAYNLHR